MQEKKIQKPNIEYQNFKTYALFRHNKKFQCCIKPSLILRFRNWQNILTCPHQ